MELGTDTTARIAADILIAALEGKAIYPPAKQHATKDFAEEIGEAFTIIPCGLGCSKRYTALRPSAGR